MKIIHRLCLLHNECGRLFQIGLMVRTFSDHADHDVIIFIPMF